MEQVKIFKLKQLWDEHVKGSADEKLMVVHPVSGSVYVFTGMTPAGEFLGWKHSDGTTFITDGETEGWTIFVPPVDLVPHYELIYFSDTYGDGLKKARELYPESALPELMKLKNFICLDKTNPIPIPMRNGNYVLANGAEVAISKSGR